MRVIPLAILMTFTLSIGLVSAVEVEIPYENFQLTGCSDVDGVYTCQWMNLFDETPTDIPTDIPEETAEEAIEEEIPIVPEVTMTREERDIQRMIDKIELDLQENPDAVPNVDRQLLILLKKAQDLCEFGIEEGQPIQTYARFAIPKGFLYSDDTDFSKNKMYGDIYRKVEECGGWDKYKVSHLGPQYADIYNATVNFVPWSPSAILPVNVTNTAAYMNRFISEHKILEEEEDAAEFMCSVIGKQRGLCPHEPTGINLSGYADISDNPVLRKYFQYKIEPESAVGEPKYDVTTNAKCAILSGYVKQFELSDESRDIIMQEAGCKI